ncbi:Starch-binding associating with outer membrane [Pricia antarctica]|uniref:Starch-binding associating with outer membrane n=1 Tax=Pricia antarctica TaxID=641691 RepID=A0A1G7G7J6_9FLAO|nr:RagB/SusD family nutrient uptake outer membrane protein [Pricia antarctica]SDE84090.1 Starch-binding associating with outer membrane [Pricia antarctica]
MRKLIYILLSISLGSILLNACSTDLDEEKIVSPPVDSYFKTEKGFNDLVNSNYTFTRSLFPGGNNYAPLVFFGTDLWTNGSDGTFIEFNAYNTGIQPANPVLWNLWAPFYQGIAACNTAISRASEVNELTENEVNAKVAESYFLRAWYYHILVVHFGDLPLVTEEVTEVVTTATRNSVEEVYAQIEKDLLFAEQYLPATQSDFGRVTKPAAQALLARVYLTLEQNDKAAAYAKKVINDYDFALLEDFSRLWDVDNRVNSEVIWSIQFSQDERLNGDGNAYFLYFTPRYDLQPGMTRALENDRPWPRFVATRYYFDLLASNRDIDSRFAKSWKTAWIANNEATLLPNMQIGDTAFVYVPWDIPAEDEAERELRYGVFDINDLYDGENPIGSRELFPQMRKYKDPLRSSINSGVGTKNVIEIRLAEMYLIAAEALMKDGNIAEGVDYINTVRKRAAWPGQEDNMVITDDQLDLDFVLEERALELGGERFRWSDLKRTGKLLERVKLYNTLGRDNIEEKHLLRPIPSNMIDRLTNRDEFEQNPGY